jgi:uncharacterized damage-inducible protein DinB
MSHQLNDLVRHNTWANRTLFGFLQEQPASLLGLHIQPGGHGTILETVRHIVHSEASYLRRLIPGWDKAPWLMETQATLEILQERHEVVAAAWEELLASDFDQDAVAEARGDGKIFQVTHGVVFTQAMHHGSEHRAQICDVLGYHGVQPPDVSSWDYAIATGRSRETGIIPL